MATKKRMIDAHDLWTDIMMLPHNGDMISSEEVEQAIKDAPTVDAVEVVRCKDCTHSTEIGERKCKCELFGVRWLHSEAYCAYGERKDNGKE